MMTTRRSMIAGLGAFGVMAANLGVRQTPLPNAATPAPIPTRESLTIDLSGEPNNLTPALSYSQRDWSILHSVYDALIDFDPEGNVTPLAAESFTTDDAVTFHVTLRKGLTFHDGSPVTTAAITRIVNHIKESKSQISDMFGTIDHVKEIDDLTADIVCSSASAWLPAQLAVWGVLIPESATKDSLASKPVGSGPYVFKEWKSGSHITLTRNPAYPAHMVKGAPMAESVTYRFVPESGTRVADLSSGQADVISDITVDQMSSIADAGATPVTVPILGMAFVRIATDAKPFDDPRVCQAVNHAVDVQAIAEALIGPEAKRLASVFPDPRGLGYDASLQPFAYDPDKAKSLLADAGHPDGFATKLQLTANQPTDVAESIAQYLSDVGIQCEIVATQLAEFNEQWNDRNAPALRLATWRPFFDPHTFLNLVVNPKGFLSRYTNEKAGELITEAASAPDRESRQALYAQLGKELQASPTGIYLWNLTSSYGVSKNAEGWTPRGDEYVLPLIDR